MILEIDIGAGYVPVACLTQFTENESAQSIGTTTRDTGGWRDGFVTFQLKQITGQGIIPVDTALFSYDDMVSLKRTKTTFSWKIGEEQGFGILSAIDLNVDTSQDVSFSFTIECIGEPIRTDVAPSGYSINFDFKPINASNQGSVDFTISGAFPGWDYTLTITSTGGGTPVVLSGTAASSTVQIPNVDLSSLTDGIIKAELSMSNAFGTGPDVSDFTVLNTSAPSGYSISFTQDPVTGIFAGVQFAAAQVGSQYTVEVTGSGGTVSAQTGTITETDQVLFFNISPLDNGTITVDATLENGNGVGPNVQDTTTKSTAPPSPPAGYTIVFNDPTLITLSGGNGLGNTYNYAITSSGGGSPVVGSGNIGTLPQSISVNTSSLPDGTLTVNFTVVGNEGTETLSDTTTKP